MSFRDLNLKNTYDSDEDDILGDFYIPALSASVRYDRLAGYFSSTTLATSAKGMADFIEQGGKMRLVTSVQMSEQDRQAILDGISEPEDVIASVFWRELDVADNIQRDHVMALAWMISQGTLDIKVAVPANERTFLTGPLDPTTLYHQKIGILYDAENHRITFSGSINETGKAWNENIEEFKVFCDWKSGQEAYGDSDAKKFEKFWLDNSSNTRVFDLPSAVREHLINLAPRSKKEAAGKIRTQPTLRSYQNTAVNKWRENNCHGIFEMATGTGKTWAAIACIKKITESSGNVRCLVVVACPSAHLIHQWAKELKTWGFNPLLAYGKVDWRRSMKNKMYQLKFGIIKNLVMVATHKTFSSEPFIKTIRGCDAKLMLIGDEVHGIGAEKTQLGLLSVYEYRLGLSATPQRYFDEPGTQMVFNYFGGVVFKFDLNKAIQEGYLTRYRFFPRIAYLTNGEMKLYLQFSKRIAIEQNQLNPNLKKIEAMQFQRSNVVKNASQKIDVLADILDELDHLDHCLIYCADNNQIERAFSILNDKGVIFHRFTQAEPDYMRTALLDDFDKGRKPVLLAIRCLDEGVDIPSTKTAIILASSGNSREFIQRRGRVLRLCDGKEYASIYDVIAMPEFPDDNSCTDSERTLIMKELDRLKAFADSSMNPFCTNQLISNLKIKYKLR